MSDMAILNTPVAAPPKPAQPASKPAHGADRGETADFAAELNRQLTAAGEAGSAEEAEVASPGPGRDAGKGRETGESAPETDTDEQQHVQGQSRASGREAGTDRLALVAQLQAAAAAAAASADGQAEVPVAATGASDSGDTALAGVAPAAAQTAIVTETATVTSGGQAPAAGQAAAPLIEQSAAGVQASADESAAAPIPASAGDRPAGAADGATATMQTDTTVTPAANGAVPVSVPAGTAATADDGSEPSVTAAHARTQADGSKTVAKNTKHSAASDQIAADSQPASATGAEATEAATDVGPTGSQPKQAASQIEARPTEPAVKQTATPAVDRSQARQDLAGDELARLTGSQPGTPGTTAVAASDKASLPQPVAIDVIDQLVAGAKMLRQGPVTEMRLQLKPEFLGRVDLKVTMEGGILSARILVDSPQVKAAIEANLPQLKQDLAQQGIALQGMTVGLGGGRNPETGDSRQSSFQRFAPQYQAERNRVLSDIAARHPVGSGHRLDLIL